MWMRGQVAEKMSFASTAKVGTVRVISMIGLIGPMRPFADQIGDGA